MSADVARVFDAMAGSYDELEPWYQHLYAVLHEVVRTQLARPRGDPRPRALDVGCGTGYQTTILEELGYEPHGVDLSEGLLTVARSRCHHATFARGDATALPHPDASFDVVTCCGSTLSFIDDLGRAIGEMGRVLRPGGRLLLECEHRWSLDLLWGLLSAVTGNRLGYGLSFRQALGPLCRPWCESVVIDYPLPVASGRIETVRLQLFTRSTLAAMLRAAGLRTLRAWGVHMLTNILPSTVLHRERLGRSTAAVYRLLCRIDDSIRGRALAQRTANSLVVLAVKE